MAKKAKKSAKKAPWDKANPKKKAGKKSKKLSPAKKAKAKKAAKRAGRKYPSLVDNMNAAKKKKTAKKSTAKKKATKKKAKKAKKKKSGCDLKRRRLPTRHPPHLPSTKRPIAP